MYRYIPNGITVGRIILTPPLFILAFFAPVSPAIHLVVVLSVIALAVSDTLDGKLARRWNCKSKFGEKWDPIADKLAVLLYVPLCWFQMISLIPVILIFGRDLLSSGLRLLINQAVPARPSGKAKTVVNLVFMCVLFSALPVKDGFVPLLADWRGPLYWISGIAISLVCLWSGWDYIRALWLKTRE